MNDLELKLAHASSFMNKSRINSVLTVGCFHCLTIFPTTDIIDWVDGGETAICPHCNVDSLLYDNFTEENLLEMKAKYF